MDIGYVWDELKLEETNSKHGVSFAEVVDVLEGRYVVGADRVHHERLIAIGSTNAGRILTIVFTEEDSPLTRIVTAFEASREQRLIYEENYE
jgi:uncharacterized DUF497 family protein